MHELFHSLNLKIVTDLSERYSFHSLALSLVHIFKNFMTQCEWIIKAIDLLFSMENNCIMSKIVWDYVVIV